MTMADDYMDFLDGQNILYDRDINGRVRATILQEINEDGGREKNLALALFDRETGRWIVLKLSTFRKVWAFLVGKRFDVARHMKFSEVKKLVRQDEKRKASGEQEQGCLSGPRS